MEEQKIQHYITETMSGEAQKNAMDFANFLQAEDMRFERGGRYWEDKLYWCINYMGENVGYVLLYSPISAVDSAEPWVVWTDDSGSNWFADYPLDEQVKVIAWKNIDICGNTGEICGGCMGRTHKKIFGKEFDNVCGITFRFNNPNGDAVECLKKLVKIRKRDIEKNHYASRIVSLDREKWQGYELPFRYVSYNYYDVEINRSDSSFQVSFTKKPFDTPFEHLPNEHDKLFQPWWDDIKAWGIVENGRLIAAIETSVEEWSNRLKVTELWVDDAYRRKGIATALMDIAVRLGMQPRPWNMDKYRESCAEGWLCSAARITAELGYVPSMPLQEGIADAVAGYKKLGWL
jgi:ribosomal protein S18 acetylase RimI-like enzyme